MDGEADLIRLFAHDLDGNNGRAHHPLRGVSAVGEGALDEWEELARDLQEQYGAITILDRSRMSLEHKRTSIGIDESVALAAFYFLAGIITARTASLSGLNTLAIEHGR